MTTQPDLSIYAAGSYQHDLLAGRHSWSGSTLKGKAKKYAAHYAESRGNLIARIRAVTGLWCGACLVLNKAGREERRLLVRYDTGLTDYLTGRKVVDVINRQGGEVLAVDGLDALPVGWRWA